MFRMRNCIFETQASDIKEKINKSPEKKKKSGTFLSSETGKKGSFLAVAAAGVGDKELK